MQRAGGPRQYRRAEADGVQAFIQVRRGGAREGRSESIREGGGRGGVGGHTSRGGVKWGGPRQYLIVFNCI